MEGGPASMHDAAAAAAVQEQQQQPLPIRRASRQSTDSAAEDGSYWGSPMKHEATPPPAVAGAAAAPDAAPLPVAAQQTGGLSSFNEISRMICAQDASSPPLPRPNSIKVAPGLAARLLDEQGSWGTLQDSSPCWGTPREQGGAGSSSVTPTSASAAQSSEQPGGQQPSGHVVHKLHFGRGGSADHPTPSPLQSRQHGGDGEPSWLTQEDERDLLASSSTPAQLSPFRTASAVAAADGVAAVVLQARGDDDDDDDDASPAAAGFDAMDYSIPVGLRLSAWAALHCCCVRCLSSAPVACRSKHAALTHDAPPAPACRRTLMRSPRLPLQWPWTPRSRRSAAATQA